MLYQIVRVGKPPRRTNNPASYLQPPGPSIELDQASPVPLKDWNLSGRVIQELLVLTSRIQTVMPPGGGVLLWLAYHEERGTPEGLRPAQHLVAMEIAGTGRVAALVTKIDLLKPRKVKRAPRGWAGKTVYLWVPA
jgi:hypothetical protein